MLFETVYRGDMYYVDPAGGVQAASKRADDLLLSYQTTSETVTVR